MWLVQGIEHLKMSDFILIIFGNIISKVTTTAGYKVYILLQFNGFKSLPMQPRLICTTAVRLTKLN